MAVLFAVLPLALGLEVYVVPHSQVSADWVQDIHVAFTQTYYDDQVRSCLDSMLDLLSQSSIRRFAWSEV